MADQPTPPTESAKDQHRAAVVAGIRALADFIENNPALPLPHSVNTQHSIFGGLDDTGRELIRQVGEQLQLPDLTDVGFADSYVRFDDESASARYEVAKNAIPEGGSFRAVYVVHGNVREAGEQA
jgi:hypothetical protein